MVEFYISGDEDALMRIKRLADEIPLPHRTARDAMMLDLFAFSAPIAVL